MSELSKRSKTGPFLSQFASKTHHFNYTTMSNVGTFLCVPKLVPFRHNLQAKHNFFAPLQQQMSELSYDIQNWSLSVTFPSSEHNLYYRNIARASRKLEKFVLQNRSKCIKTYRVTINPRLASLERILTASKLAFSCLLKFFEFRSQQAFCWLRWQMNILKKTRVSFKIENRVNRAANRERKRGCLLIRANRIINQHEKQLEFALMFKKNHHHLDI